MVLREEKVEVENENRERNGRASKLKKKSYILQNRAVT